MVPAVCWAAGLWMSASTIRGAGEPGGSFDDEEEAALVRELRGAG